MVGHCPLDLVRKLPALSCVVQLLQHLRPGILVQTHLAFEQMVQLLLDLSLGRLVQQQGFVSIRMGIVYDHSERFLDLCFDIVLHGSELSVAFIGQALTEQTHIRVFALILMHTVHYGRCPLLHQTLQSVLLSEIGAYVLLQSFDRHLYLLALLVVLKLAAEYMRHALFQSLKRQFFRLLVIILLLLLGKVETVRGFVERR